MTRRAIVPVVLASVLLAACVDMRVPLVVDATIGPRVPSALPGTLTVLRPYDLRPSPEHTGLGPGLENVHLLVGWSAAMLQPSVGGPLVNALTPYLLGVADSGCGTFVTGDADFSAGSPTDGAFDPDVAIPAAIGECLVRGLVEAGLFERVARLDHGVPQLAEVPLEVETLAASPGDPWRLEPAAQEARELQLRALATPLPPCGTPWLLRVHVLHAYAARYERRVYGLVMPGEVLAAQSPLGDDYWSPRFFRQPPFANVALTCQLYHLVEGLPVLVWDKTVCGAVRGSLEDVPGYARLTAAALAAATGAIVDDLRREAPAIHAWLGRRVSAPRTGGAKS